MGLAAALVASTALPAAADEESTAAEYTIFYGTASPPTSYGGYGGNAKEDAKYSFEYPANWKYEAPNKIQKGSQGIDCRLVNPRAKAQQAFVVTFGRAGEDNKSFRLNDIETTLAGFAQADSDMQDALSFGEIKSVVREVEGQKYYEVEVDSPDVQYLASITVKDGKVFGMFVKTPTRLFEKDAAVLRHMAATFTTI